MIISIPVALAGRGYEVQVGSGLVEAAGPLLAPRAQAGRIVVVSDQNVWSAQGERLRAGLEAEGLTVLPVLVEPGEQSKSWIGLSRLLDHLLELGLERSDYVVAFGGGMVGDLAGLAASLLKRGCGLIQIPTSLLAQVDSSVGGKTGINVKAGKNLVGTFHQPDLVLVDPDCLRTLPEREMRSGLAEVVKYGLIGDATFFTWCESSVAKLIRGESEPLLHAIRTSIAAKAAIVVDDEREQTGRRALLNLGHTFGHALEAEAGFSDRLLHGEAVAAGMAIAFRFAAARGQCPQPDSDRVAACLRQAGLPVTAAEAGIFASGERLVEWMKQDKKARAGTITFILPRAIGDMRVATDVDLRDLAEFLDSDGALAPAAD